MFGHLRTHTFRALALLIMLCALPIGCASDQLEDEGSQEDETSKTRVGINTIRDPIHKGDGPCGPFPSEYLKYLDDTECRKTLPSNRDREFHCPVISKAEQLPSGYLPWSVEAPLVDSEALKAIIPEDVSVTVILIRRVDGVPHYRYISNGSHDRILELWSSSKFLGIMNASENIRYYSDGEIGLDSAIKVMADDETDLDNVTVEIPLGDLATIVHNYDEKQYTSNGLMYWFHDIGGRHFANQLIHERWLHRPEEEVFGANYGAKPPELGFTFSKGERSVDVKPDQGWTRSNKLSTYTLAEALKRLVMYRENPESNLEFSTWEDVKVLLYGAPASSWYTEEIPQGMESDPSTYVQEAVDIKALDRESAGRWRIFSKLGLGFSRGGEIVHTDYVCLPTFDNTGEPVPGQGAELVISIHQPVYNDYVRGDQRIADLYREIIALARAGSL